MARIFFVSMLVALSHAAPSHYQAVGPLVAPHVAYSQHIGAPAVVGHSVQEQIHAGPAISRTHHEVVGHRTVQVGTQAVQVGHNYVQAGQTVHQPAPYSYQAGEAKNTQTTYAIAPPAIPSAPLPYVAIPPAPTNQGPAPADTVTQQVISAPVRTHTIITPKLTRIEPELQVNRYAVEVPVAVPVAVEREVIYETRVAKPYNVDVPQPYAVPTPYVVNPVQHIHETPVVDQHHVTVHQPAVAYAQQPAVVYAQQPAVAYAPQPAYAHVGYGAQPIALSRQW